MAYPFSVRAFFGTLLDIASCIHQFAPVLAEIICFVISHSHLDSQGLVRGQLTGRVRIFLFAGMLCSYIRFCPKICHSLRVLSANSARSFSVLPALAAGDVSLLLNPIKSKSVSKEHLIVTRRLINTMCRVISVSSNDAFTTALFCPLSQPSAK
jgi:hypothetical protein